MTERARLDQALVSRGLARSRTQAQAMIRTGRVRVAGEPVTRPSELVTPDTEVAAEAEPYVSRAAYKLVGALDELGVSVGGRALDGGTSTGGFTQVLLERGCTEVFAVDVGTDQLDAALRLDPRIRVREQTSLRDVGPADVDDRLVDLAVADVSFISLTKLVGPLASMTDPDGAMLLMVKPQFEVGRAALGHGGVVREPELQTRALESVAAAAQELGWFVVGAVASRLPGPAGNREFFLHLLTRAPRQPLRLARVTEPDGGPAYADPDDRDPR